MKLSTSVRHQNTISNYNVNKWVLRRDLNESIDEAFWICGRSLFQRVGAMHEKAWALYRVLVCGPWIICIEEDEQRGLAEEEDRREIRAWRYWGARLCIILYTKSRILNVIRELFGSQCMARRTGDMWSSFLVKVIILAAVFWICWSGERYETGRPTRRELQ